MSSLGVGLDLGFGSTSFNKTVLIVVVVLVVITLLIYVYNWYMGLRSNRVWVLDGTKSGRKRMVVLQDPRKYGAIPLERSDNQSGGLEYGYSFWMYIDDWSYKYGEWKHVLHKGNESAWPLRGPSVWLHPRENTLHVSLNTFKNVNENVDVGDMPLNKWVHIVVSVKGLNLDVYVNGNLAKHKELSALPKQNYGNLYLNNNRGFSGYLSNVKYYRYTPTLGDIEGDLSAGPSAMPCVDSGETPPYLSNSWWLNK